MGAIHYKHLTSDDVRELAEGDRTPVLLLPVGAIEPHGPHAPLATDGIIARATCERAARALVSDPQVRALVLPTIPFGVTRYAEGFAGTLHVEPSTLRALLLDVCRSLARDGLARVAIVNHHFEPEHVETLRDAAQAACGEGSIVELLELTRRRQAQRLTDEFQRGSCHAGQYETSLVLAEQPALVDMKAASALPALEVNMPAAIAGGDTSFAAMGMTQAYCGDPAAATAAEGDASYDALAQMLIELVRELAGKDTP